MLVLPGFRVVQLTFRLFAHASWFPIFDATGNVAMVVDGNGRPTEAYEYSPYGERIVRVNDLTPPVVEQVRVVGDELRLELSEEVRLGAAEVAIAAGELRLVDTATGQQVALKRLAVSAPAAARVLFEREYCVLVSLKHPRIIEVYEYGLDDEGPFYTMELLEGRDLRELAPLSAAETCRYLRDVASSLALLHARRLLHRDVSARNVRRRADGSCKLIDFGALMSFGTSDQIVVSGDFTRDEVESLADAIAG